MRKMVEILFLAVHLADDGHRAVLALLLGKDIEWIDCGDGESSGSEREELVTCDYAPERALSSVAVPTGLSAK